MDGGDLFMAALGGMLGEELIRKIATHPYGFIILWLASSVLIIIIIAIFLLSLATFTAFKQGTPAGLLSLSFAKDFLFFFFVMIQPWASLFSLGMGLLLALSYRFHYRNNSKLKSESELITKEDKK